MADQLATVTPDDTSTYFSEEELGKLDMTNIPRHIAFIMDGNRRWARQRDLPPFEGHWEGGKALMRITRAAASLGVQTITAYAFSTENWGRSPEEVKTLMNIFSMYLRQEKDNMIQNGVRLGHIGDLSLFPDEVLTELRTVEKETASCSKINLVLALNYGGRDDITRAAKKAIQNHLQGNLSLDDFTEKTLASYLDTAPWGDPDLLVRTSGEMRISNFLLWQLSYSELYVTETFWPSFDAHKLHDAILAYQSRERRYGG